MADLTPVKTWTTNETLTSSDLNTEFLNVYNNVLSKGTAQTITGVKTIDDDTKFQFGAAPDYWFEYDSVNTQFEFSATDIDGGGTDGIVFTVNDGTDDVSFTGGISTDGIAAPTTGITSGGNIVSDTDSTDDLGTPSVRWANLYVDDITLTTSLTTGGAIAVDDTTDSTSGTTGSIQTDGGLGVAKNVYISEELHLLDSKSIKFGTGEDATINYDGTNLVVNPKAVGSGYIDAQGDLYVADGNSVVVGHTAQVSIGGVSGEFEVLGTAGADANMALGRWSADAAGPFMTFVKSRNATIGSSTIVQDNDILGQFTWCADDGADFATVAAQIRCEVDDGTPAENQVGGALAFRTSTTGGSTTEAMRIDSSQQVGIGGTPSDRLHVFDGSLRVDYSSGTGNVAALYLESDRPGSAAGQQGARISFYNQGAGNVDYAAIYGLVNSTDLTGSIAFYTNNNGTNTERVRIDPTGNVGIGGTPGSELHLAGGGELQLRRTSGDNNQHAGIELVSGTLTIQRGASSTSDINFGYAGDGSTYTLTAAHSTASVKNPRDSGGFYTGAGDDLRMYHDGTQSWLANETGNLYIDQGPASSILLTYNNSAENLATFAANGAVTLYYDNSAKLATNTAGVSVTGILDTSSYVDAAGGVYIGDVSEPKHIDDSSNGASSTTLYIGNASINVTSDVRAKRDIEDYSGSALDVVDKAHVVEFEYIPEAINDESKFGPSSRGRYVGLLAQEMKEWAPWAINDQGGDPDMMMHAEYQHTVPLLFKAIQELRQENRELREMLN
jgi:hypothetical protein